MHPKSTLDASGPKAGQGPGAPTPLEIAPGTPWRDLGELPEEARATLAWLAAQPDEPEAAGA